MRAWFFLGLFASSCYMYDEPGPAYPPPPPPQQRPVTVATPPPDQPGQPPTTYATPPPEPQPPTTYATPPQPPATVATPPGQNGEVVWVPADKPEPAWSAQPLEPGVWYVIEASGVFSAWPDHTDGIDAYYGYAPWRVGQTPQVWAQLLVNDRPMYEIAHEAGHDVTYHANHVYTTMVAGNGQRLKLQLMDARNGSWNDNHGALQVRIWRR